MCSNSKYDEVCDGCVYYRYIPMWQGSSIYECDPDEIDCEMGSDYCGMNCKAAYEQRLAELIEEYKKQGMSHDKAAETAEDFLDCTDSACADYKEARYRDEDY